MRRRGRLALVAAIAAMTAACSLVASLGDDFTTLDAGADAAVATDGGIAHPAGDAAAEASPPCISGQLDPSFANGPVVAMKAAAESAEAYVIFGLATGSDGGLVVGVNHTLGNQPYVEVARFDSRGAFLDAGLATDSSGSGVAWAGNGTSFAALVSNENGAPPFLLLSDAYGHATTLPPPAFVTSIAMNDEHLLLGVIGEDFAHYGVMGLFLDGGSDLSYGSDATTLQERVSTVDGGGVCDVRLAPLGGGGVLEVEQSCTGLNTANAAVDVTTPRALLVLNASGAMVATTALEPQVIPTEVAAVAPAAGDAGAFVVGAPAADASVELLLVDPRGVVTSSFNNGTWAGPSVPGFTAYTLVADSQGRAWLVGMTTAASDSGHPLAAVARLLADGGLDPSWADGGVDTIALDGAVTEYIADALLTSDGRLTVALAADFGDGVGGRPALVRVCP